MTPPSSRVASAADRDRIEATVSAPQVESPAKASTPNVQPSVRSGGTAPRSQHTFAHAGRSTDGRTLPITGVLQRHRTACRAAPCARRILPEVRCVFAASSRKASARRFFSLPFAHLGIGRDAPRVTSAIAACASLTAPQNYAAAREPRSSSASTSRTISRESSRRYRPRHIDDQVGDSVIGFASCEELGRVRTSPISSTSRA